MGIVITLLSGKGGTGKTTTAAALGCALSELEHKVVVVDADAELRNLDLSLGMEGVGKWTYADVVSGNCRLDEAVISPPGFPGLHLLDAPLEPTEEGLTPIIPMLRHCYDYCIIDCPGGMGREVMEAALGADLVLVVATADPSSHRDGARIAQVLRDNEQTKIRLILNRISPRLLKYQRATLDDSIDKLGLQIIGYVPEDDDVVLSLSAGTPLLAGPGFLKKRGKKKGKGAAPAFRRIARRITGERVPIL